MASSLTDDAKGEDWSGVRSAGAGLRWTRAEWLWTIFGLVLLVTFLFFVIDDYPLRGVLAIH